MTETRESTLDRDVRFSPEMISATQKALRTRKSALGRSIASAEASRRAGVRIQHGTHDRNVSDLVAISATLDALEVAQKQIQHRIRERLGLNRDEGMTR
jgi:hypothetical protein